MHWIIEALANVFLEIVGDMMSWTVQLLTQFEFNMGFNIGYTDDAMTAPFSPGQVVTGTIGHDNLFEKTFGAVTSFSPYIMAFAAGLALVIFITKMIIAMGGPFTRSEDPGTITIRFIGASVGVTFSYSIIAMLEWTFNGVYGKFMDTFVLVTKDATKYATSITKTKKESGIEKTEIDPKIQRSSINSGDAEDAFDMFGKDLFKPDASNADSVAMTLIEIAVFVVLLVAFAKLILEIYERYVMLGVLFYFAPLAFSTLVSQNSNVFSSYIQMLICEFIVMCSNLFFTGIFIKAWVNILNVPEGQSYLFESPADFVTKMFLLISWLIIGQQFDQHLKGLGLSSATTGAGLGGAMMAGAGAAFGAISTAKSALGTGAKIASGQTTIQRGISQGTGIFKDRDPAGIGLTASQKAANDNLKKMDSVHNPGTRFQDRLANGDQKSINELARNVGASMGGTDKLNSEIKKATGQSINDITSAKYEKGVFSGTTQNGQEFAFYNRDQHADTSSAQTTSVNGSGGWERGLTNNEVQGMINDYKSNNADFLSGSNGKETWTSTIDESGTIRRTVYNEHGVGKESLYQVPGLKAEAHAIDNIRNHIDLDNTVYKNLKN